MRSVCEAVHTQYGESTASLTSCGRGCASNGQDFIRRLLLFYGVAVPLAGAGLWLIYRAGILLLESQSTAMILGSPISRPLVKGMNIFWPRQRPMSFIAFRRSAAGCVAPGSSVSWLRTHDESRRSPIRIKRRPNSGLCPGGLAAPEERWYRVVSKRFHRALAAVIRSANPLLARDAGDPLVLPLMAAIRRPIQSRWFLVQTPILACRIAVVPQAKQRVTSNGLPSFRM
jgi:hypothetical protein